MDYIQPQFKGDYFNGLYEYGLNIHNYYKSITTDCVKKIFIYIDKLQSELMEQNKLIKLQTNYINNLKAIQKNQDYDNLNFKYSEIVKEYRNFRKKTNRNIRKDNDTNKSNDDSPPAYDFI
jgi:hypothetical protein